MRHQYHIKIIDLEKKLKTIQREQHRRSIVKNGKYKKEKEKIENSYKGKVSKLIVELK